MQEKNAPERIDPQSLGDYLEVMSKAVFQASMSWRVVGNKWGDIREAFRGFDVEAVAAMGEPDLDALAKDTRVIRNARKLAAIVGNAGKMLELEAEHGSFRAYLRSHDGYDATVASLSKEFKFLGDLGCYYFLSVFGEDVPSHDEWMASHPRK
jgi:3-methyladenine DNA glycosylase Tag